MKDEDIDRIIAENCGWMFVRLGVNCLVGDHEEWGELQLVPEYCRCLNAMYDAEKRLLPSQWSMYITCLNSDHHPAGVVHQTARFKAEAYVRALGKWEDKK